MAWEIIPLKLTEAAIGAITSRAIKLFQEHSRPYLGRLIGQTHDQKFLTLNSKELTSFYKNERTLSVQLSDQLFQIPASILIEPTEETSLSKEKVRLVLNDETFEISKEIDSFTAPMLKLVRNNKHLYDGCVISLRGFNIKNDNLILKLTKASYFDALATNFSMDYRPKNRSQSLREFVHGESRKLCDFNNSYLVNHIGVGCIVETADGFLVAPRRSKKYVSSRSNTLSISVNAVLEFHDLVRPKGGTIKFIDITKVIARESFDELGIHLDNFLFLGMIREFWRGGKPEFYFYSRSNKSLRDIQNLKKMNIKEKQESTAILGVEFNADRLTNTDNSKIAFCQRALRSLEQVDKEANLTLIAAILLTTRRFLQIIS